MNMRVWAWLAYGRHDKTFYSLFFSIISIFLQNQFPVILPLVEGRGEHVHHPRDPLLPYLDFSQGPKGDSSQLLFDLREPEVSWGEVRAVGGVRHQGSPLQSSMFLQTRSHGPMPF